MIEQPAANPIAAITKDDLLAKMAGIVQAPASPKKANPAKSLKRCLNKYKQKRMTNDTANLYTQTGRLLRNTHRILLLLFA